MSSLPDQPVITPSSPPTGDALVDFIESEPPGLFPDNDDSNFGFIIRRLWTDKIEALIAEQAMLYNERFVATSKQYLDEWEIQEGLAPNPAGYDQVTRQSMVQGRITKGPFTRTMRAQIVERYITATFGTPSTLTPSGIKIGAGIPLKSGLGSLVGTYAIVENIPGFSYTVRIKNTITVSAGLQRELTRVTPAGISFSIVYVATP